MAGSWKIGSIAGIGIHIHATFLLLVAWVLIGSFAQGQSVLQALGALGFLSLVFAIIVLHELGHALTAKRFGVRTRDITLLPIGGVARLERIPEEPIQELLIALAGPAVNFVLAGLLFAALAMFGAPFVAAVEPIGTGGLFEIMARLFWFNLFLGVFNLLPAFPMDGGRVARALMALWMDRSRATRIAATLGRGMAVVFGMIGIFFNPILVFIALFVWIGATQEEAMVQSQTMLGGVPVHKAMITGFQRLAPTDPLQSAVDHVIAGFQQDFPVLEDGRLVGILTRSDLVAGLTRGGNQSPVADSMQRTFATADPEDLLEKVLPRLQESETRTLFVIRDQEMFGMVTLENVAEYVMLKEALQRRTA